jgi:hypothetical protein
MRFAEEWRMMLEGTPNLDFYQEMVKGLIIENESKGTVLLGLRYDLNRLC